MSVRLCQVDVPAGGRQASEAEAVEEVGDGGLEGRQDLSLESSKYAGGQSGPSQPEAVEEVLYGSLDLSQTVLEDVLEDELSVLARDFQTPTNAKTCQEVLQGRLYGRQDLGTELTEDGAGESASPGQESLLQTSQLRTPSSQDSSSEAGYESLDLGPELSPDIVEEEREEKCPLSAGLSQQSTSNHHLLGLQRLQRLHQLGGEGGLAGAVHRLEGVGGSSVGLGLLHRVLPRLDVDLDGGGADLGEIKDLESVTSLRVRVTDHRTLPSADHPPGVVVDGVEAGEEVSTGALHNPPINIFQLKLEN